MTAPCWVIRPRKVARTLSETGADVIGINCSGGPAQIWRILNQMRQAVPQARFSVMPNAGWPEQVGGRIMYPANPDYFGDYALAFCEAGASLIGGCCGTTPQHIAAMRTALDRQRRGLCTIHQRADHACWRREDRTERRWSSPPAWRRSWQRASSSSRSRWTRRAASPRTSCWLAPACWRKPART